MQSVISRRELLSHKVIHAAIISVAFLLLSIVINGKATARSAIGPSFDCRHAHLPVERAICSDPTLSQLDQQLSDAFNTAIRNGGDQHDIRQQEQGFINRRNQCGPDLGCIRDTMSKRVTELQNLVASQGDYDDPKFSQPVNSLQALTSPPRGFQKWHIISYQGVPVFDDISKLMRLIAAGNYPPFNNDPSLANQRAALAQQMLEPSLYDSIFARYGYVGQNEFKQRRTADRFDRDIVPAMRRLAPKLPLEFIVLRYGTLGKYRLDEGGFKIGNASDFTIESSAQQAGLRVSKSFEWPRAFSVQSHA